MARGRPRKNKQIFYHTPPAPSARVTKTKHNCYTVRRGQVNGRSTLFSVSPAAPISEDQNEDPFAPLDESIEWRCDGSEDEDFLDPEYIEHLATMTLDPVKRPRTACVCIPDRL